MYLAEIESELIVDPAAPVRAEIDMAGVMELADSIREVGLIQPLVVRRTALHYEVIAGHRRLLACRELGLAKISCLVTQDSETQDVTAQRLHENLIRRDMTPVEEAIVYAELFEKTGDLEKVAKMAHRSLAVVERRLSLLSGDADVRNALHAGAIAAGVAEELNKVAEKPTRDFLLKFAIDEGASVSKVRQWRISYNQNPVQVGAEPERPGDPVPTEQQPNFANTCWLCGSQDDPHELRVRMVHQYCERMWRRGGPEGGENGGSN